VAIVLSKDGEEWSKGPYTAINDTWNKGPLVNGKDFTQTVTLEPSTFPNGVSLDWSWPAQDNGTIYGYPEISWSVGSKAVRISDIASLTSTYAFRGSGPADSYDVAFEAWLYSAPGGVWETVLSEVMLWVHSNGWKPDFTETFNDGVLNADVHIDADWGDVGGGSDHDWQYIAAINKTDKFSGTISFSNLLKDLIWKGVLKGTEYMTSVEAGAEPVYGAGSLKIDNLAFNLELKTPVAGTSGNDTVKAQAVGRNSIDLGAGIDTVVYAGAQSAYEYKAGGPGALVRAKGDLSTLDILTGVEKLQFDDGTFDVATGAFAQKPAGGSTSTPTGGASGSSLGGAFGLGGQALAAGSAATQASYAFVSGLYANILRVSGAGQSATVKNDIAFDAMRIDAGQATKAQIVQEAVRDADATTTVATLSYQFFTGKIPSQGGIDYLVSPTGGNAANLNSAYYQSFNLENRYINFAVNLGKLGEGRAGFEAKYGAKTLAETVKDAYGIIFGSAPNDAKVADLVNPRASYFQSFGGDGPNGVGTKAAAVGWLLAEAAKADIGTYARASDAFLTDLADGAAFAVDLVGVYGAAA
jgi:hypothetical protein